jgi:hypothetical protein
VCHGRDNAIGNLILLLYAFDIKPKILGTGINGYIIKSKKSFAMCQVGLFSKEVFVNFVCRFFCSLAGCLGTGYIQAGFGINP